MTHSSYGEVSALPRTVVFFGDSLTAGYGLTPREAYPELIREAAEKEGVELTVVNAGVSGDTSAGGVRRVGWALKKGCDVFVLALGANDGLRGLPPPEMKKNLLTIIRQVRETAPQCRIVLAGMYALPNLGRAYSDDFKRVFSEIATEERLAYIPFLLEGVAGVGSLNQADRLHPNAEGQKLLARTVWPVIKGLLNP